MDLPHIRVLITENPSDNLRARLSNVPVDVLGQVFSIRIFDYVYRWSHTSMRGRVVISVPGWGGFPIHPMDIDKFIGGD